MRFARTERFKRMYKKLKPEKRNAIKKALKMMEQDLRHPSLRVKRIQGTDNIWEASATMNLRITFNRSGDMIVLRNCGEHDKTLKNP